MSRPLKDFQKEQFGNFIEHVLSAWGVGKKQLTALEEPLKQIHKRYLGLACISTIIGERSARGVYIDGVAEASHLSMVLSIKGLENPACVLLRQSVELVLKHIFFSTHPVEFGWADSQEGYKELTFQKLIEYIGRTEELQRLEQGNQVCVRLNECFGVLSRYVHVHSRGFIGYKTVGRKNEAKIEIVTKLNERTREIWPVLTAILVVYFPKKYLKANVLEQRVIRSGITKDLLGKVDRYLIDC
jgi:hypothetical protein